MQKQYSINLSKYIISFSQIYLSPEDINDIWLVLHFAQGHVLHIPKKHTCKYFASIHFNVLKGKDAQKTQKKIVSFYVCMSAGNSEMLVFFCFFPQQ